MCKFRHKNRNYQIFQHFFIFHCLFNLIFVTLHLSRNKGQITEYNTPITFLFYQLLLDYG